MSAALGAMVPCNQLIINHSPDNRFFYDSLIPNIPEIQHFARCHRPTPSLILLQQELDR